MRINSIYLDAFGPFTGTILDFSGGSEGLHIVYGQNEAGKSSVLRAITQMFYGIPARSSDTFIHNYSSMCIGASISDGSQSLDFIRRKANKGTLRSRDSDEVLDDASLDEFLGGIDENTFTMLFGLNHETLVNGGREIVEGRGNVGETIFSASAGLSNLREVLVSLNNEAGELFKMSASKPSINAAIKRLHDVRKDIKAAMLRPSEWQDKNKELHDKIESRNAIELNITLARTDRNRISRIIDASPVVAQYSDIKLKLDSVLDAVLLPENFGERFGTLLTEQKQTADEMNNANNKLKEINKSISSLTINKMVLEQELEIESLNELYAANKKALIDCEQLKSEVAILEKQAQKKLELFRPGMKFEDISKLRVDPALNQRILELGKQEESLNMQHETAVNGLKKLRDEHKQVVESLKKAGTVNQPDDLSRTIKRIRRMGDLEKLLHDTQYKATSMEREINAEISRLGLWQGSIEDLEALAVPSADTIDIMKADFDRLNKNRDKIQEQLRTTDDELKNIEKQIIALKLEHEVPTEAILVDVRELRYNCWRLVRLNWEQGNYPGKIESQDIRNSVTEMGIDETIMDNLADTYETITVKSDDVADRLRSESKRVAELAQLEASKTQYHERLAGFDTDLAGITKEFTSLKSSWESLWMPLGVTPLSPREMETWTQKQREIVKMISEYREITTDLLRISTDIKRYAGELNTALTALGEDGKHEEESLTALLDRSEDIVETLKENILEKEKLEEKLKSIMTTEIPDKERVVALSEEMLNKWLVNWRKAMVNLGENEERSPGEIHVIIQQMNDITSLFDKVEEKKIRIEQIELDNEHFREEVRKLASVVNVEISTLTEEQASQKLYSELKYSRDNRLRLESLEEQLASFNNILNDAQRNLDQVVDELEDLCRTANVSSTDELPSAWDRSCELRKYEDDIQRLKERIVELSSGQPIDEFITSVMNENIDALKAILSTIVDSLAEYEEEKVIVSEEIGSLNKELAQMDGNPKAALLEEEAQALLAVMSDDAMHFTRLKISEFLLARAIEQYRAKNQGPLLNRAGEIFSKLTLHSFQGLSTDFGDKDESILVGVRSDGIKRVTVSGMSDGSADQLYLSLRLASIEQYISAHRPIPFILDDILINFDDDRATATLEILADLSSRTQIIFFTHHKHIVELAKSVIDDDILCVERL